MNTLELACGHTRTVISRVAKLAKSEGYFWCIMCGGYQELAGADAHA